MSEVTYFILYILQHNKGRHQPFWSDPLNRIFCLSLIFLSGDALFSPCAGATLACAGRGKWEEELPATEAEVLVAQSRPTLCNPMDCSPIGFSVHGIL